MLYPPTEETVLSLQASSAIRISQLNMHYTAYTYVIVWHIHLTMYEIVRMSLRL